MIGGLEYFLAEAMAAAAWPDYSYAALDISLLGAATCGPHADPQSGEIFQLCSPRHAVMNAGFVLVGALHIAGLVVTRSVWRRGWLAAIGLVGLGLGAAGAMLVGFAPLDLYHRLHVAGAGLALVVGNAGLTLLGLALLRRAPAFGLFSLAFGAIPLTAFLLYSNHIFLGIGRGSMERLAANPQTVWYAVVGVMLIVGVVRDGRARL